MAGVPVPLSEVKPDFEDFVQQLQDGLRNRDAWRDLLTAGTGQTLIEFMATIGAYNEMSIQRALQESMLDTARLPSSVLWITRMLGVHISRRHPPRVLCDLVRTQEASVDILEIPPFTQFFVNNSLYFNRERFIFIVNQLSLGSVYLYEGEVTQENFTSNGEQFQVLEVGVNNNTISDVDLKVQVGTQEYTVIRDGLYRYTESDFVCQEKTLPNGNVEILFGNGTYGRVPASQESIVVTYVRTNGLAANKAKSSLSVNCTEFPEVTGVTTSGIHSGANEKNHNFYRYLTPGLFASQQLMVRRNDHNALAMEYPGVIDAIFRGQAETHPDDVHWMNTVEVTLLTLEPWNDQEWDEFVAYIKKRCYFTLRFVRVDPDAVNVDINCKLFIDQTGDITTVRNVAQLAIQNFFTKRIGSLGFHLYKSDIYDALMKCHDSVRYVELIAPQYDRPLQSIQYFVTNEVTVDVAYGNRPMKVEF